MTITILFAALTDRWEQYQSPLTQALDATGLDYNLVTKASPETVDYIVYAPNSDVQDFTPYTRLKAVLNLWAGVEEVVKNNTLQVPLTRMVDNEGLTQGMVEWVTGHTMRHHLGMDAHIVNPDNLWGVGAPPLSYERPITILGMGILGQACAKMLTSLGFPVTGWSRTAKSVPGVTSLHGDDGLEDALTDAQILILLLPDTPATENILNAERIALLAKGAVVINPGRGPLIDDQALIDALDRDHLSHATLDVFRIEPLPSDDPFWSHPKVTVTPHIASETRPKSASKVIAENIRRSEAAEPLLHVVDRTAGY